MSTTRTIQRNAILAALLWTLLILGMFLGGLYQRNDEIEKQALLQADAFARKDLSFRSWASSHGGVYVRPTADSPPNPYLKVPDRDVVTTGGMKLTLVNPAYMVRQVLGEHSAKYGIMGHLTSHRLQNPNNRPDPWEDAALHRIEAGEKEVHGVQDLGGREVLRYMRPVFVEQSCLKCHDDMGYKIGEVRGGLSSAVDLEPFRLAYREYAADSGIRFGLIWIVGLIGIGGTARRFSHRAAEREQYIAELRRTHDEMEERVRERTEELTHANTKLSSTVAELEKHQREMHLINQLNDTLQSCQSREEGHRVLGMILGEMFGEVPGALSLVVGETTALEVAAHWGRPCCTPVFETADCWAIRQGHPHSVLHESDGLFCSHFLTAPASGYLCLPLIVQGRMMGIITLIMPEDTTKEFSDSLMQLATNVGEAVKLGLANLDLRIALREQATHDALTGLYNRRYLDETLPRELHRTLRAQSTLVVAMMDIDHFKRFNDTYGHEAGDLVLREIGRVLTEGSRKSDIACRYGGEELVLILPDTALEDALKRVEQIRAQIKELNLHQNNIPLGQVTLSAGVAQAPADAQTATNLLHAADQVLYTAKQAGRDCTRVYQSE